MKKTTSHKAARRPAKQTDRYRQITDRIVVALESGVAPWRKPWRAASGSGLAGLPLNATTGRHYSGVNVLLLWMSAEEQGFRNNRWMTYRQISAVSVSTSDRFCIVLCHSSEER